MANQIRITPDQMRQRANQYRREASNVGEVIRSMDNLLNALQGEWEGEASRAYGERFGQLRPGFVKAQQLIDEIAVALDATARNVEETDASIASQFRG